MTDVLFIPTYWSTDSIPSWKIFDHPFAISETGTLQRTLRNLEEIGYRQSIFVLPVPCEPVIVDHVQKLCANRPLDLTVFSATDHASLLETCKKAGLSSEERILLDCHSYGGVRNIGLAYAALHGFDRILMIDDDECIDADYRNHALEHLGQRYGQKRIGGKTGCVTDEHGCKVYDGQAGPWGDEWPKDELFNRDVRESLERPGRIVDCTVAFGGNMILDRLLFTKVPFDPLGTRGEDDDYLLNARYCGEEIFFDKDLVLLHLPPTRSKTFWSRQRQDIIRFLYTREKIDVLGIDRRSLGTFLRYFTDDDLESKAVRSSITAALHFDDTDKQESEQFLENARQAVSYDRKALRSKAERFRKMIPSWQQTMERIAH